MHATSIALLAIASLAADVVAVNVHRHGHGQLHEKKDLKIQTNIEIVTQWVTVTYDPNAKVAASTKAASVHFAAASHSKDNSRTRQFSPASVSSAAVASTQSSVAEPALTTSAIVVAPTTLATIVKPSEAEKAATSIVPAIVEAATVAAPVAPTVAAVATPATTSAAPSAAPVSTGGKKRGLAYNDPTLLSGFVGDNSKVSWAYSWSQVSDLKVGLEFIPMLWGPGDNHVQSWASNANKAIAAGSSALLSFNEPDNAGQSNIDPATAATEHIKYMNPFQGKARISTPAITNSGTDGQGISWLTSFMSACGGKCAVDFAAVHWYSNNGDDFLSHLVAVHEAVNLPVWVTEFAPVGNEVDYNEFLATVVHELDNNPKYSFVERYSYFMVAEGQDHLVTGGQPNKLGNTFAYAS